MDLWINNNLHNHIRDCLSNKVIKKIPGILSKAKRWTKANTTNIETFITLKSYAFE